VSDTTPDDERPHDPVVVAAEAAARRFLADVRALPRHHPGCLCPLWNALEDAILLAVDERVVGHADALAVTDAVQTLFWAMEGRRGELGLDPHTVDGEPLPVAREPIFARVDVHFAGQVMPVKNALALAQQAAARSVAERELATPSAKPAVEGAPAPLPPGVLAFRRRP